MVSTEISTESQPRIPDLEINIRLDGTNGNLEIFDSEGVSHDKEQDVESVHARAMGPMQFIPDTWLRWGMDVAGAGAVVAVAWAVVSFVAMVQHEPGSTEPYLVLGLRTRYLVLVATVLLTVGIVGQLASSASFARERRRDLGHLHTFLRAVVGDGVLRCSSAAVDTVPPSAASSSSTRRTCPSGGNAVESNHGGAEFTAVEPLPWSCGTKVAKSVAVHWPPRPSVARKAMAYTRTLPDGNVSPKGNDASTGLGAANVLISAHPR